MYSNILKHEYGLNIHSVWSNIGNITVCYTSRHHQGAPLHSVLEVLVQSQHLYRIELRQAVLVCYVFMCVPYP
jgi:hypothetical protein